MVVSADCRVTCVPCLIPLREERLQARQRGRPAWRAAVECPVLESPGPWRTWEDGGG